MRSSTRTIVSLILSTGLCACGDGDPHRTSNRAISQRCSEIHSLATASDLALTPRADTYVESLALSLTERLVADQPTYERIIADVEHIRMTNPAVANLRLWPEASRHVSMAFEFEGESARDLVLRGEHPDWNCAADHYKLRTLKQLQTNLLPLWYVAYFDGTYDMSQLVQLYAQFDGLMKVQVWSDYAGDGSSICVARAGDTYRYVFDDAAGDCPSGCTEHLFYYFESLHGGSFLVGMVDSRTLNQFMPLWPQLPQWTSDFQPCRGSYAGL